MQTRIAGLCFVILYVCVYYVNINTMFRMMIRQIKIFNQMQSRRQHLEERMYKIKEMKMLIELGVKTQADLIQLIQQPVVTPMIEISDGDGGEGDDGDGDGRDGGDDGDDDDGGGDDGGGGDGGDDGDGVDNGDDDGGDGGDSDVGDDDDGGGDGGDNGDGDGGADGDSDDGDGGEDKRRGTSLGTVARRRRSNRLGEPTEGRYRNLNKGIL